MSSPYNLVILATTQPTKLEYDIKQEYDDPEIMTLRGIPKPLLPISGKPAINWWYDSLSSQIEGDVFIVTNAHNGWNFFEESYSSYLRWASSNNIPRSNIINNGNSLFENCQDMFTDIELVKRVKGFVNSIIVVQAELLFDSFNNTSLRELLFANNFVKFIFFNDNNELSNQTKNNIISTNLLDATTEPYQDGTINTTNLIAYMFHSSALYLIEEYTSKNKETINANDSNDSLDCVEKFIQFMMNKSLNTKMIMISYQPLFKWKDPVLTLKEYMSFFKSLFDDTIVIQKDPPLSHQSTSITTRSYARIGLIGNPSDGFYGKTISLLISNFFAEITLIPNKFTHTQEYSKIEFFHSMMTTTFLFKSIEFLSILSFTEGYTNANRLFQATCKVFFVYCKNNNLSLHKQGFRLFYETNIPRQVGLSGSSAIITSLWKALMKFYRIGNDDISLAMQAKLILDVELIELGISAGLQDRVIQSFGGVMYMDFEKEFMERNGGIGRYIRVPSELIPKGFWIAYEGNPSDSGKIHNDVRKRFEEGDKKIADAMIQVASFAEQAYYLLLDASMQKATKRVKLAKLMNMNFNLRLEIYGNRTLGKNNLNMIELARKFGFAAKFTGSGGSIVGLWEDENDKDMMTNVEKLKNELQKEGFVFCWVKICDDKYV
ncbi:7210_t:CDS:2 [Dentiscutata erythropus]|uniref:7210_t:CDS:1 n=1 Tax=Dentiscutata erythropus TaxID=1348616 RepID=A0A9N9FTR2_9GLOM|nr:7210_t:CDS:2 [Dentiscutata erythropus]